jgi:diketogulonate reductase-like aldo/keto reductase
MVDKTISKVLLNDGLEVPAIGFGTYICPAEQQQFNKIEAIN